MQRRATATDMRFHFARHLDFASVRGDRVLIVRHEQPVAALVSMEDLALLESIKPSAEGPDFRLTEYQKWLLRRLFLGLDYGTPPLRSGVTFMAERGLIEERPEGLAITEKGRAYIARQ